MIGLLLLIQDVEWRDGVPDPPEGIVLVYHIAPGCEFSRRMDHSWADPSVSAFVRGRFVAVRLDASAANPYGVRLTPTVLLLENGEPAARLEGYLDPTDLHARLDAALQAMDARRRLEQHQDTPDDMARLGLSFADLGMTEHAIPALERGLTATDPALRRDATLRLARLVLDSDADRALELAAGVEGVEGRLLAALAHFRRDRRVDGFAVLDEARTTFPEAADRVLWTAAVAAYGSHDRDRAIGYAQHLVNDHPSSPHAASARRLLEYYR